MKCRISGASIARGRFSTKKATFVSLNGEEGYETLTDGTGITGSDFWMVLTVIGGRALWIWTSVNLARVKSTVELSARDELTAQYR